LPETQTYDLLVVGGGINGAGIARDAAGRGLSVALCEMNDLASATSSASSKLIHGGLRYLEYYEFRLVREALAEREVLLHNAPHLVRPLQFVLPHVNTIRPAWLVRLGLFIYDHLGAHPSLPNSKSLNLRQVPAGKAVRPHIRKGFSYYDCRVDDAPPGGAECHERGTTWRPHHDKDKIGVRAPGWRCLASPFTALPGSRAGNRAGKGLGERGRTLGRAGTGERGDGQGAKSNAAQWTDHTDQGQPHCCFPPV
jgi:hypothetical protein